VRRWDAGGAEIGQELNPDAVAGLLDCAYDLCLRASMRGRLTVV
jgi:hypothetical protein